LRSRAALRSSSPTDHAGETPREQCEQERSRAHDHVTDGQRPGDEVWGEHFHRYWTMTGSHDFDGEHVNCVQGHNNLASSGRLGRSPSLRHGLPLRSREPELSLRRSRGLSAASDLISMGDCPKRS
jgi:hypothetical protein